MRKALLVYHRDAGGARYSLLGMFRERVEPCSLIVYVSLNVYAERKLRMFRRQQQ